MTAVQVRPDHVHRTNAAETFVTTAWDTVTGIGGTLRPRDEHGYYGHDDDRGVTAALYGLEVLRQAETLFAHEWLGRPGDTKFVWRSLSLHVSGVAERESFPQNTFELSTLPDKGRSTRYHGTARLDDVAVVLDELVVTYVDADTYRAMRGSRACPSSEAPAVAGTKLPADEVGRSGLRDVAVVRRGDDYVVGADYDCPTFFEHAQDHWPGMVLLDAATQLTTHLTPPSGRLSSMDSVFSRYGELTDPVTMSSVRGPAADGDVRTVVLEQGGRVATTVDVGFS